MRQDRSSLTCDFTLIVPGERGVGIRTFDLLGPVIPQVGEIIVIPIDDPDRKRAVERKMVTRVEHRISENGHTFHTTVHAG